MMRVLDYIAENLDRDLDLEEVASVACFSAFHFHRVFTGVTGESMASLVRRLRLEKAACRLLQGGEPSGIIAFTAGYESAASFTRAFRNAFGETPSVFRRLRRSLPLIPSPSGYHYHPAHGVRTFRIVLEGEDAVEGKTVMLEPMRILSVEHRGSYFRIGSAFERLGEFVTERGIDVSGSQWLGIYHGDGTDTPEEELRSEACVTVGPGVQVRGDGAAVLKEIPGGLYATTRHVGSYRGLGQAWRELCGTWVPANGLMPRESDCFEIYIRGGEGIDESEFLTDLYEPVEPV
jgi:AraC family transcriptional regulator